MNPRFVFMGVAGCGKSTAGAAVAADLGLPLVEGDDFHSAASRDKMARGIALTDADRAQWLVVLGQQLAAHTQGVVLTCSALKRAYRDQLRQAAPGLRFVFLEISRESAQQRVSSRGAHFFSDVAFSGVFTFLIIWLLYALIYRWRTRITDEQVERAIERVTLPVQDAVARLFGRGGAKAGERP